MGVLAKLVDKLFGCRTREEENPVIAAAGAAAAVFLLPHPDRLAWVFVNLSANPIYIGLTNAVGVANGMLAQPNGGAITCFYGEDFTLPGRRWWCIAPAGASNFYVLQVIGEEPVA